MKTDNPGPPRKREEGKIVCQEQKKHHRENIKAMKATEGSTWRAWVCVVGENNKSMRSSVWFTLTEMALKGHAAIHFNEAWTTTQPRHPDGVWNNGPRDGDLYENNRNHGPSHWNRTMLCTILSHTSFHLKQWHRGLLTLSCIYSPFSQSLAWVVTTAF